MINQAMKEKLTRNNHNLEDFRSGLNMDIDKSLSMLTRSKQLNTQTPERNFMGEFQEVINSRKVASNFPKNENLEVKNSYRKYLLSF